MEKLGDDMLHLKSSVWPLLEKFWQSEDVPKFRKQYRRDMADVGIFPTKLTKTKAERDVAGDVQGEGTYEPRGSYGSLSPCLDFKLASHCGTSCMQRPAGKRELRGKVAVPTDRR